MNVTPFMEKGELYRLRNMSKNKHHQCLTANKYYIENNVPVLQPCRDGYGWPGPNVKRYRDGDLFLCLKVLDGSYVLLSPDGIQVSLWHARNKGKFARVK
jgi:hypothetical protein